MDNDRGDGTSSGNDGSKKRKLNTLGVTGSYRHSHYIYYKHTVS